MTLCLQRWRLILLLTLITQRTPVFMMETMETTSFGKKKDCIETCQYADESPTQETPLLAVATPLVLTTESI